MGVTNPQIIIDKQLSASSSLDVSHNPSRGRLYFDTDGTLAGGWSPRLVVLFVCWSTDVQVDKFYFWYTGQVFGYLYISY